MSDKRCHFTHIGHTRANSDVVGQLLDDVDGWPRWARPLVLHAQWERWGTPTPGGIGAVRRLGARPVWIREQIIEREPGHQRYTVLSPNLFRSYTGTVTWVPDASGGTKIEWSVEFVSRNRLAAPLHLRALRFMIGGLLQRLIATADNTNAETTTS
jgi:hypothetical protein